LTSGATLLYASSNTDTSFLRLNSSAPPGAAYSGWATGLPALYTPIGGIHNPQGDLQKISSGNITDYSSCIPSGDDFFCIPASPGSADHIEVVWSQGITEGGSSGSGLWIVYGSSHYLVGQLHGGSSSCVTPTAPDYYGRFDVAYNTALSQWLTPPLILSTTSLSAEERGVAYVYALQAEGGLPPYTWSRIKGKLPNGLILDAAGTLSGIPTKAKTATFTVQVTDSAGTSATQNLSLQIVKPVDLKTKKLSRGTVGTPYAATLKTKGGIPPLTFSLVGGALPPGLTFDPGTGQIFGTPTLAETFDFQMMVTSSGGSSDQGNIRIKIK
jgi:hypothetical protein